MFTVKLGGLRSALRINGGNWDAEGACELVSAFLASDPAVVEVLPVEINGAHVIAVHYRQARTRFVQAPES